MAILWLDGFEHGRADGAGADAIQDGLAGTPTVVTTPSRTGARALELNPAAAAEWIGYTTVSTVVTQSVYIRFAALPAADSNLMTFVNANGNGQVYFDQSAGQLSVRANGGSEVTGGPSISVDTWYRVTAEYDTSGASCVMRATIQNDDGSGSAEISTGRVQASANTTSARLGTPANTFTYTCYYDDWVVSVTDGDYEDIAAWTGHSIESLIPTADGTHNIATAGNFDSFTTTAFDNSTTNGNTFIGHRPLQAANTADQVIRQDLGTTAEYMEFTLENLSASSDTVQAVRTYATHIESSASGSSLGSAKLLLSDDTEVLTTGDLSVINSSGDDPSTNVTIRKRMAIAPSGGWDRTKVDGLKARVGFGDGAPDVNFIDFMVEVLLETAAAAAASISFDVGMIPF